MGERGYGRKLKERWKERLEKAVRMETPITTCLIAIIILTTSQQSRGVLHLLFVLPFPEMKPAVQDTDA